MARISWAGGNTVAAAGREQMRYMLHAIDENLPWFGMEVFSSDADKCVWQSLHTAGPGHIDIGSSRISGMEEARLLDTMFSLQALEERTVADRVTKAWRAAPSVRSRAGFAAGRFTKRWSLVTLTRW